MIRFEKVSKRYGRGVDVLSGLDLNVDAGEFVFLTGPSGAGKSTLLKLVALIQRPTRGQVVVNGVNTGRVPRRKIPYFRRGVGMVFQDHKLLTDRTVFDNVAMPMVVAHAPAREIGRRVRAALDLVGLSGKEQRFPLELSSGEQQRVGIARSVVGKPPLLIADEPTGNLDPQLSLEIMQLFGRFNELGVTLLIASHDAGLIEQMGHRQVQLQDGRLVGDTARMQHSAQPAAVRAERDGTDKSRSRSSRLW